MKHLVLLFLFFTCIAFSQDKDKGQLLATKKSNNLIYEANNLMNSDNFISAEKEYRKAISEQPSSVAGAYNLGNSYYKKGSYDEALYRQVQAANNATDKAHKHKAFHNIGNILMKNDRCHEAVEAYKNALRNDPTDDETRYNLGLAKECAEQQKDERPDDDKGDDNQDQNQNQNDQDDNDQQDQDNNDNNDQDGDHKNDGDDKEDEGQPENEEGKDENQEQKPQPQSGSLSPQQIQNLLDAMNNQEQKVQEKMNADKHKGIKIQTDKDW